MAADGSLLELEGVIRDASEAAAGSPVCLVKPQQITSCSETSSAPVLSEEAAKEAALAAAAQAESLSARCKSLLPLLQQAAKESSKSKSAGSANATQAAGSWAEADGGPLHRAEFLDIDSDGEEGPVVELEVGVGVLDVRGQVPDDSRLAAMGIQVVDLPEDSPFLQNSAASKSQQPLDALHRVLAARARQLSSGQKPLVSVLSSGSSSEAEDEDEMSHHEG